MPSVLGVSVDYLDGLAVLAAETVEVFQRIGVDGVGSFRAGSRGEPFALGVRSYVASSNAADTLIASLRATAGTIGDLVDEWGVTTPNILVTRITNVTKRAVVVAGVGKTKVVATIEAVVT